MIPESGKLLFVKTFFEKILSMIRIVVFKTTKLNYLFAKLHFKLLKYAMYIYKKRQSTIVSNMLCSSKSTKLCCMFDDNR